MVRMVLTLLLCLFVANAHLASADPAPTPLNSKGQPAWATGSIAAARQAPAGQGPASLALGAVISGPLGLPGPQAPSSDRIEQSPGFRNQAGTAEAFPFGLAGPQTASSGRLEQSTGFRNQAGIAETFLPSGAIASFSSEPFFQSIGSNGRSCQDCHEPDAGWSITPKKITALYKSDPSSPLFRPVDGTVCPTADTSSPASQMTAYSLLLNQGLIRVFIPLPSSDILQFRVSVSSDPYNCTSNSATGLTSPTSGLISQYRRPLPATNLPFMTTIMWDGREPDLASQAADATQIHAQADVAPNTEQSQQFAALESRLFSAQNWDNGAGDLTADGAQGGAQALASVPVQPGANAPGPGFNPSVMTLYLNWIGAPDAAKAAIARGQTLFNERTFDISDVAGLNDVTGKPHINGTCSACHNTPQVGNHSSPELVDLGLANVSGSVLGGTILDNTKLPVFTVQCTSGPLAGTTRQVTDLGRGLITGQCADIGKFKTALLRNLAARPPYFHNGSAPDLETVVEFYNNRFSIGLSDEEKADLVAFLKAL